MKNGLKRDENLDKYYSQFLLQNQICSSGGKSVLMETSVAKRIKLGIRLLGAWECSAAVWAPLGPFPVLPREIFATCSPHFVVYNGCRRWVKVTLHQMACKTPQLSILKFRIFPFIMNFYPKLEFQKHFTAATAPLPSCSQATPLSRHRELLTILHVNQQCANMASL